MLIAPPAKLAMACATGSSSGPEGSDTFISIENVRGGRHADTGGDHDGRRPGQRPFEQALVGLVDLVHADHLDVAGDVVLPAEIEHLLGLGETADERT